MGMAHPGSRLDYAQRGAQGRAPIPSMPAVQVLNVPAGQAPVGGAFSSANTPTCAARLAAPAASLGGRLSAALPPAGPCNASRMLVAVGNGTERGALPRQGRPCDWSRMPAAVGNGTECGSPSRQAQAPFQSAPGQPAQLQRHRAGRCQPPSPPPRSATRQSKADGTFNAQQSQQLLQVEGGGHISRQLRGLLDERGRLRVPVWRGAVVRRPGSGQERLRLRRPAGQQQHRLHLLQVGPLPAARNTACEAAASLTASIVR